VHKLHSTESDGKVLASWPVSKYSGTSIYRFSRWWRNKMWMWEND